MCITIREDCLKVIKYMQVVGAFYNNCYGNLKLERPIYVYQQKKQNIFLYLQILNQKKKF